MIVKKRVAVGMSGGVDSSVAAYLLLEQGYDVTGVTMQNGSSDTESAADVCRALGIGHHIADMSEEFESVVIGNLVREYFRGRTPNPCVVCNPYVKWPSLINTAEKLGADYVATGHYSRVSYDAERRRYNLCRASSIKDQSYALYRLNQEQLAKTIMPLFPFTKDEVRETARKAGLFVSDKKDSQEICFIPDGGLRDFLSERGSLPRGKFIDLGGKVLGEHLGLQNYTVGQRKGLGIALGKPVFVKKIDAAENTIVLAQDEELYESVAYAGDLNFVSREKIEGNERFTAKIRYSHKDEPCSAEVRDGILKCVFDKPQRAMTPGQSLVLYDGDYVVAGGIIM